MNLERSIACARTTYFERIVNVGGNLGIYAITKRLSVRIIIPHGMLDGVQGICFFFFSAYTVGTYILARLRDLSLLSV
jgi:hypothetical protein